MKIESKRTELRFSGDGERFCEVEIVLSSDDQNRLRLSICGTAGSVLTELQARKKAIAYWESYFEECPAERLVMIENEGRYLTNRQMARKVLESDGEFHGLDVHRLDVDRRDGKRVLITESCGQILDELKEFFPAAEPYFRWHLNDMHAECVHQEARNEDFVNNPGAKCPDCGYILGNGWTYRELPAEVIAWARGKK